MGNKMATIKKEKNLKNIGGHKPFGVDIDPNKDLCLTKDKEKGHQAYYKGSKMKYMDYYDEIGNRMKRVKHNKGITNIGVFSGISFDENGKVIQ